MKALVGSFNQEKALVGAFSVIVKTGCGTDGALHSTIRGSRSSGTQLTLPPPRWLLADGAWWWIYLNFDIFSNKYLFVLGSHSIKLEFWFIRHHLNPSRVLGPRLGSIMSWWHVIIVNTPATAITDTGDLAENTENFIKFFPLSHLLALALVITDRKNKYASKYFLE